MTTTSQGRSTNRPYTNNAQRGAALEELLNWKHNQYAANNLAYVWHAGTQGKIVKGKPILIKSQPDYAAILSCLNGRFCAFDAKHCAKALYSHPTDRLHQLSSLWAVQEAGGIAFLFVSWNLERHFLLWPQVSWRDERPYSVRLDRLERHHGVEVWTGGSFDLPDWLGVIKALYGAEGK